MCRVATAEFGAGLLSVSRARHWVAGYLRRWELPELTATATLLTSELVANAVIHAGGSPALAIAVATGALEVGVTDPDPLSAQPITARAEPRPSDETSDMTEAGRGLFLVARLSDEWGVATLTGKKHVWFRLHVGDWAYLADCRCHDSRLERFPLKSGHFAHAMSGPWASPEEGAS